jgi:small-conductance mechanosensitive channel
VKFFKRESVVPPSDLPEALRDRRSHLTLAAFALVVAIVAFSVSGALGDIHGTLREKLIAFGAGALFVVASVVATRAAATEVYEVVGLRTGPRHAGVLRWMVMVVGYLILLITALGLFAVPVKQLIVGGALTGVIVGIAAQQALGNVFAGVVLLIARPFSVGDAIRIKAGNLGGVTEGTVSAMGMTYVTLLTDEGPVSMPNSGVLAAAVGPMPGTSYARSGRFDLSGQVTGAALVGRAAAEHTESRSSWEVHREAG